MAASSPIRFVSKDKSPFFNTLNARVDEYFRENKISKHANAAVVGKSIILMAAYLLPLAVMVIWQPSFGWSLALWATMGVGMAGVGMSVMHDACHGAYSASPRTNRLIGYSSLNLLGGSVLNWKLQHNHLHHTFTNIVHHDEDIDDKGPLRFSPHTPLKSFQRFQWAYALLFYSILTLFWVVGKDFVQFARYTRNGVNRNTASQNRVALARIVGIKIAYFAVMLGLPIWSGIPVNQAIVGFLLMHAIGGIILTVIFQLAHTVEGTTHPRPNAEGIIENDWAIHQMNTTVNFSRQNRWLSWYLGGLNFQVEHHLFPKICHVHYPKIAEIVRGTAAEFNVPYLEHPSFGAALRSHFATLRRFGKLPDWEEAIG